MVSLEEITRLIIESGAVSIRNEPFVYSSGNRGPGYVMIKGLVGTPETFHSLMSELSKKVKHLASFDFINGNATGGMIPGYELSTRLSKPFVYMRETRKAGGHNELVVGLDHIKYYGKVLIVEELVNYAETTINAANAFREMGYECTHAACILSYDTKESRDKLQEAGITLISLITLPQLLNIAKTTRLLDPDLVDSYLEFLDDPIKWQVSRGLSLPESSALVAEQKGYKIMLLDENDPSIPECKRDFMYYKVDSKIFPFIWLAMDYDTIDEVLTSIKNFDTVEGEFGYKINLNSVIDGLLLLPPVTKRPIFVDLKMWNGVETMRKVLNSFVNNDWNIKVVNIYAHAGNEALSTLVTEFPSIEIYAVTILTHYDDDYCQQIYGCSMGWAMQNLFDQGVCCTGVITPAKYVSLAKSYGLKTIVPGIRINSHVDDNDEKRQKQIGTIDCGADAVVIGREITKSDTPVEKLKWLLKENNI